MKTYLGIDLGTSALKLLLTTPEGTKFRAKCAYKTADPAGWLDALKKAVQDLPSLENLGGIALSAQVGTYITDDGSVIGWQSSAGSEELRQIKQAVTQEEFLQQIGMAHPDLISYPLPRLLYVQKHFPECKSVCMPKELLLQALTGNLVSDVFSWRGLCHPKTQAYAAVLLDRLGIQISLPPLKNPDDLAGTVTEEAAKMFGLPVGTPVYVGCNDFFAGLLGMGVWETGSIFELSGTSEHLGVITPKPVAGKFVSGAYFNGCATYGGTKSSGVSCDFAIENFGIEALSPSIAYEHPPVFLPYLKGERAPVYDESAKGVFFGITENTTKAQMAYAVLEGVVFSLYHISQSLPLEAGKPMITGGGSAGNPLMATLKAALFSRPVLHATENDASAMGAAMIAMTGGGEYPTLAQCAASVICETIALPDEALGAVLKKRFSLYEKLYPSLKQCFQEAVL